jgi:thiol-disulfide isomerase/thioredoxin
MLLRKSVLLLVSVFALTATWAADVPRKCPDYAVHLSGGNNLPLSNFKGKLLAVAFILTTCPHCQHYTQTLSAIQKDYGPRGVQILAVAFDDNAQAMLPNFIKQFQPAFPVGWENRVNALSFLGISILNQGYVPKIVFIDRNGMIQKQYDGQDAFFQDEDKRTRATLDEMLKPQSATAVKKTAARK